MEAEPNTTSGNRSWAKWLLILLFPLPLRPWWVFLVSFAIFVFLAVCVSNGTEA
jgi:hypothetical protein